MHWIGHMPLRYVDFGGAGSFKVVASFPGSTIARQSWISFAFSSSRPSKYRQSRLANFSAATVTFIFFVVEFHNTPLQGDSLTSENLETTVLICLMVSDGRSSATAPTKAVIP